MKYVLVIGVLVLCAGCAGASKQNEFREQNVYYQKRIECEKTKYTDETANLTQCVRNVELEDAK